MTLRLRMHHRSAAACTVVLASIATPAAAQTSPSTAPTSVSAPRRTWDERRWGVELQLGLGTPTGLLGAVVDATPLPWWTISAGIGEGGGGPQFALGTRFRVPGQTTFYAGLGMSAGRFCVPGNHEHLPGDCDADATLWNPALWVNGEIGLESVGDGGFVFRAFLGAQKLLNESAGVRRSGIVPPEEAGILPSIGLAFGHTL